MKKLALVLAGLMAFTVFACVVLSTPSNVLYFLNWGEYIDESLVKEFERKFQCQVVTETVISSEAMYQKITSGTSSYDVAVPGDYTVRQLYNEGYLRAFDIENDKYPRLQKNRDLFISSLNDLTSRYMVDLQTGEEISDYYFPYFHGTYSLIYSERNPEVKAVIEANGFQSLFDKSLFQEPVKTGMYNTARWLVASALLSEGLDPNLSSLDGSTDGDIDASLREKLISKVKGAHFDVFGDDDLKRSVANGTLDFCFTQLGDFFDTLYLMHEEGHAENGLDFSVNVPKFTAAFFDSMVIPTTCQNYELANAFVNFMMEAENAYQNARAIGYSPVLKDVHELYVSEAESGAYYFGDASTSGSLLLKDFLKRYPMFLNPLDQAETLFLLEPKSANYLTSCETILNSLATA